MVPSVYFLFPETAYRSLEEMDSIFRKTKGAAGWFNVVRIAHDEPHRYGKDGELLIAYDETEEHAERQASVVSGTDMARAAKMVAADKRPSSEDAEKGIKSEMD